MSESAAAWTFSSNEETWSESTDFATREEAEAEAQHMLDGLDPGDSFWTGRAVPVATEDLAEVVADADDLLDRMESWLYDKFGGELDTEIRATTEQKKELEDAIKSAALAWLTKHDLAPKLYSVEDTKKHAFRGFTEAT